MEQDRRPSELGDFAMSRRSSSETADACDAVEAMDADELRVSAALADARWSFRTVQGIATELELPVARVEQVVEERPDLARKSVMTDREGHELYTAPGRSFTPRERVEQLRWLLAR